MAKAYAAKAAMKVCADAVQIWARTGSSSSQFVEKWYRDIKVFDIFEGTGQIQRIVISKRILQGAAEFLARLQFCNALSVVTVSGLTQI